MKWIGLTGGIASGKSSVTKILRSLSYNVIDADEISHQLVESGSPGLKLVIQGFGKDILSPDGSLDRRKLGRKVFNQPQDLEKLNNILHPLIRERVSALREQLQRLGIELAFYDVPLLFEKKMQNDFDAVVVVSSTVDLQTLRLRSRNQLTHTEIKNRLASQLPMLDKEKLADFVIYNNNGFEDLKSEVLKMLDFLKARN